MNREGLVVETSNGNQNQNLNLAIANRCLKQMREYLIELGMSPSSRSRLSVRPQSEENEETKKRKRLLGPELVQ